MVSIRVWGFTGATSDVSNGRDKRRDDMRDTATRLGQRRRISCKSIEGPGLEDSCESRVLLIYCLSKARIASPPGSMNTGLGHSDVLAEKTGHD